MDSLEFDRQTGIKKPQIITQITEAFRQSIEIYTKKRVVFYQLMDCFASKELKKMNNTRNDIPSFVYCWILTNLCRPTRTARLKQSQKALFSKAKINNYHIKREWVA